MTKATCGLWFESARSRCYVHSWPVWFCSEPFSQWLIQLTQERKFSLRKKRLTWIALRHASAPRAPQPKTSKTKKNSNVETYKDRINTLLLVATIIIIVTFAAGITVPGGYDDSRTHKGMALMVKKFEFQVFVIANAVAMCSSIIVAVLLIWAQLGDLNLVRVSLKLASPLFGGALTMVAISFMTGVYLVVSNLNWLSYVILIMGLIFVLALSTLLILFFLPTSLNHRMLRYIFYYPFSLLLLISKKWR
ncbi:protein ACCELERATED CELL DEATH 6-like isoform X1 [Camellia sinensis]|uniref:protein ACCELERATED CELL DEATH 6-like isoform X1 n=1 Tax=Camellia sinensis TaxID=4442 RepID=UPI001036AB2D|nr:protein ACCELERATED CELL DEATH 6-like isoform X1 [Camellia sinensis]